MASLAVSGGVVWLVWPQPSTPRLLRPKRDIVAITKTLLQIAILYLGPMVQLGMKLEFMTRQRSGTKRLSLRTKSQRMVQCGYELYLEPIVQSFKKNSHRFTQRWIYLRNLVIAPVTEELVFRYGIVSLLQTEWSHNRTTVLAPFWFSVAHVHHAILRYSSEPQPSLSNVCITALAQCTYTSLFGSYATHVLLQTQSVAAAIASHMWCNAWGLPSVGEFTAKNSPLYRHRHLLWTAHGLGIVGFGWSLRKW